MKQGRGSGEQHEGGTAQRGLVCPWRGAKEEQAVGGAAMPGECTGGEAVPAGARLGCNRAASQLTLEVGHQDGRCLGGAAGQQGGVLAEAQVIDGGGGLGGGGGGREGATQYK